MVNFKIVESRTDPNEYEEWIRLYNEGISVKDMKKTLNLTSSKHTKYRKQALEEGRIKERQRNNTGRYYRLTSAGHYSITKRHPVTKKMTSYGTYKTLEEAQAKIKELKKNNWEKGV